MDYEIILSLVTSQYSINKETAEEWFETLERQGKLNDFIAHICSMNYV